MGEANLEFVLPPIPALLLQGGLSLNLDRMYTSDSESRSMVHVLEGLSTFT